MRWLRKLKRLPRRRREVLGAGVGFGALFLLLLTGLPAEYVMVLDIPFQLFFLWLCPKLWSGE